MVITKVMSINKDLRKEVLDLGHSIIKKLERWEGTDKESLEWASRQWHPTLVLLPGESHGRRSLVGCSPWGRWDSETTEQLHFHFSLSCIGEGNGNPLQCSCLENPKDGGAWWAAVYGVAQSWTRLRRLGSRQQAKWEQSVKPRRVGSWEPNEKVFPSGAVIGQVRWGLRNDLWIIFLEVGLIFQKFTFWLFHTWWSL